MYRLARFNIGNFILRQINTGQQGIHISEGEDLVLKVPLRFGMGFGLPTELMPISPNPNVCFWGGWGGSLAIIDADAHLSAAYVMNQMHGGLIGVGGQPPPKRAIVAAGRHDHDQATD